MNPCQGLQSLVGIFSTFFLPLGRANERFARERRKNGARLVQPDVSLTLLLRVVERVRVQETPHELP